MTLLDADLSNIIKPIGADRDGLNKTIPAVSPSVKANEGMTLLDADLSSVTKLAATINDNTYAITPAPFAERQARKASIVDSDESDKARAAHNAHSAGAALRTANSEALSGSTVNVDEANRKYIIANSELVLSSDDYKDTVAGYEKDKAPRKIASALSTNSANNQSVSDFIGATNNFSRPDSYLSTTTPREKAVIRYYAAKGDYESAEKYINAIEPELMERSAQSATAHTKKLSSENPLAGVGLNIMGSYASGAGLLHTVLNEVAGKNTDPNNPAFTGASLASDTAEKMTQNAYKYVTEKTGSEMWGNVAVFAAETGLSIAQNVSRLPLAATGAAGETISLLTMAFGAGGQTAKDILDRGGDNKQAVLAGFDSGAIEYITGKLPLDGLMNIVKTGGNSAVKRGVRYVLTELGKQAGTEFGEEAIAEIAGNISDSLIMSDKSEYNAYVKELMNANPTISEAAAKKAATAQFYGWNVLKAGLGGALSGGVLGGSGLAIYSGKTAMADYNLGKAYKDNAADIINEAKETGGKDAVALANKLEEYAANGRSISNTSLGRLYRYNVQYAQTSDRTDYLNNIGSANASDNSDAIGTLIYGGTISNKQAENILNDPAALSYLEKTAGTTIDRTKTLAEQRRAVKNSIGGNVDESDIQRGDEEAATDSKSAQSETLNEAKRIVKSLTSMMNEATIISANDKK